MNAGFDGAMVEPSAYESLNTALTDLAKELEAGRLTHDEYSAARARIVSLLGPTASTPGLLESVQSLFVSGDGPESDVVIQLLQRMDERRPLRVYTNFAAPVSPREWLIRQWLPAARLSLFSGEGGSGKSRFILMLAAAIATGTQQWLGGDGRASRTLDLRSDQPANVIIASWEDEHEEITRRLLEAYGNDEARNVALRGGLEALRDRLIFADMAGEGPLWGPDQGRHVSTAAGLTATGRRLRGLAEAHDAQLLVIDPVAAAYGGDENARALVRAFMADFDAWSRKTGCATLLIAHPPKSGNAGYSGSTDWHAATRTLWTLTPQEAPSQKENAFVLRCEKANYAPLPSAVLVERSSDGSQSAFWTATGLEVANPASAAAGQRQRSIYDD